jgi:uncharacterized protein YndB with AHSA1/START domain
MSSSPAGTSTDTTEATVVRTSIEVAAPPERAYQVFTTGIDQWWNREHHVLPGTLKEIGVEPREGGRLWEEMDSGERCTWGRVLVWDPPRRFVFSWLIGPDWGVPAADAAGSRVTVTFTPVDGGTLVELVHSGLDAHGAGWEGVRAGVGSDGGWPNGLRRFAAAV